MSPSAKVVDDKFGANIVSSSLINLFRISFMVEIKKELAHH
jgi:hypothetical protein